MKRFVVFRLYFGLAMILSSLVVVGYADDEQN